MKDDDRRIFAVALGLANRRSDVQAVFGLDVSLLDRRIRLADYVNVLLKWQRRGAAGVVMDFRSRHTRANQTE